MANRILTPEAVADIRKAAEKRRALRQKIHDELTNEALARKHGCHVRNIEKILAGETW